MDAQAQADGMGADYGNISKHIESASLTEMKQLLEENIRKVMDLTLALTYPYPLP
jgi:hypothetical protein